MTFTSDAQRKWYFANKGKGGGGNSSRGSSPSREEVKDDIELDVKPKIHRLTLKDLNGKGIIDFKEGEDWQKSCDRTKLSYSPRCRDW